MSRVEEHLRLLSIFHYIFGALMGLFSLFPILHVLIGLSIINHPEETGGQTPFEPALFGWIFFIGGALAICFGLTLAMLALYAGRCLATRRRLLYCTVIAGLMCIFMPIGTILGIFTLVNLTKPEVKELFAAG